MAEDIKLPTFDRISDCAELEFHTGLNGIPFAIRSYSGERGRGVYIPPFPSAVNPLTRKNFDTPRALNIYLHIHTHTRVCLCACTCLDAYVYVHISRNPFFGERTDLRTGCACKCT